ncbi:MAG: hypothetical protein ABIW79_04050 [Gemmatimonas sp.]
MRTPFALSLLVAAAACGNVTAVDGTTIHVRIVDERALSAGPQALFVTLPSGEQLQTRTGMDGTARIRVSQGGEYTVKVVPRDGFLVPLEQSKRVSVGELQTASVNFELRRQWGEGTPPERIGDGSGW